MPAYSKRAARLALAQEGAVQVAVVGRRDLGVRDQVVEEVGAADRVDVLIGLGAQLVLDLAPDVVALLLDRPGRRAGVVEVEVDLGVGGDPELGEQVVDHGTAVGIQDQALDRADAEMLQGGIDLGGHLREALVHDVLHALGS